MSTEEMNDAELLQLLAEDPVRNFAHVVYRFTDPLKKYTERFVSSEAEDVVQQTMLNALLSLKNFPRERILELKLQSWLYKIALNECLRRLKQKRRVQIINVVEDSIFEHLVDLVDGPETIIEEAEIHDALIEAIHRLPPESREVNFLYYIGGLKLEEIAWKLKMPLGTVKSHVSRKRRFLIEVLKTMLEEEN